jgi:hypothetical protein
MIGMKIRSIIFHNDPIQMLPAFEEQKEQRIKIISEINHLFS